MPSSFKINDIVQRKLHTCSLLNATITGKIVEICEIKLFVKVLWENNTDPILEYKRNIQRVASVIPQTSQTRQQNYNARVARKKVLKASSDSPPPLPETPQALQKNCRAHKKASNNFSHYFKLCQLVLTESAQLDVVVSEADCSRLTPVIEKTDNSTTARNESTNSNDLTVTIKKFTSVYCDISDELLLPNNDFPSAVTIDNVSWSTILLRNNTNNNSNECFVQYINCDNMPQLNMLQQQCANSNIVIMLDSSESMGRGSCIKNAKSIIHFLIDQIEASNRLAFFHFNMRPELYCNFRNVNEKFRQHLHIYVEGIQAAGGSRLINAIEMAYNLLLEENKWERKSFVYILGDEDNVKAINIIKNNIL